MIFLQILRLLAVMVLAFGAGKLASKLKMPVILGWLIAGMVLGPHALNLLDQQTLDAAWFGSVEHLLECVAGLIIGTELLWKKLRSAGRQILVTTVTESLGTFAVVSLVFACVFRITGVPVYLAFLFGGIVLATAPAPSLSIVNELKTNGPVTRTLMPMAALDDLVGATVFFVVVALVSAQISSVGIPVAGILVLVFLPVPLGGAMGFWAGCRMCRARTPAPGLWYHAGPACSHRRTGRAGKCASAGSCAELHAAGHVLFRGICQLHSRRPSGKHHACDESRHRGGADCGHFEPGCAAGLSSDFRRGDLYCRVHSGAGCGQVQRGLSGGRRDRCAQNRAQFSGLCPAAALRRVAGIHRYRGIRSERSRPRVRFHPAGTIAAAAVINEVIAVFIAVRQSWDVWSGIPVHLQVFWQMSAIVVMYWQERPLHRTF